MFPHRVVVALQLAAHRDVAFRTTGEPDAGVPESDKVIDRQHAGGAVVTGYESGGDLLGESVHQDDGESAREQGPVTLVRGAGVGVPTRDEEDPRDIAFQQEFDVFVLGDTSWCLRAQYGGVAALGEGAFRRLGEHRKNWIAQFWYDHAHQTGGALTQPGWALVSKDVERREYGFAGFTAHTGFVVEHPRDGGLADACVPRYIGKSWTHEHNSSRDHCHMSES